MELRKSDESSSYDKLDTCLKKSNMLDILWNKRLQWAGYVQCNWNLLMHIVLEENPTGKITFKME